MNMNKEKDTTVWKPKGNQKITRPSGPAPKKRKPRKSDHRMNREGRSESFDAPKSGFGKLGLFIGAGAVIAALVRGFRNSDYSDVYDDTKDKD